MQELSLILYYLFFTRPGAPPEVAPPIVTEEEDRGPGGVWYYENHAKEETELFNCSEFEKAR